MKFKFSLESVKTVSRADWLWQVVPRFRTSDRERPVSEFGSSARDVVVSTGSWTESPTSRILYDFLVYLLVRLCAIAKAPQNVLWIWPIEI